MDCLKSFIVKINDQRTFLTTEVKTWTAGSQEFWVIEKVGNSVLNIQGFKNIDIYGVDVIGAVQHPELPTSGGGIVEDWSFEILMNGSLPLVSGTKSISPDIWNIQLNSPAAQTFYLSKDTNSIKFGDPLKSETNINFQVLKAQGYGGQTAGAITLDYDLSFVFFYKYEGE